MFRIPSFFHRLAPLPNDFSPIYKIYKLIAINKLRQTLLYIGSFENTPPKFRMFVRKLPAVISFVKFFLFFQAVTAQVCETYYLQFRWSIGVKMGVRGFL